MEPCISEYISKITGVFLLMGLPASKSSKIYQHFFYQMLFSITFEMSGTFISVHFIKIQELGVNLTWKPKVENKIQSIYTLYESPFA